MLDINIISNYSSILAKYNNLCEKYEKSPSEKLANEIKQLQDDMKFHPGKCMCCDMHKKSI
jgi:hypothetical protein